MTATDLKRDPAHTPMAGTVCSAGVQYLLRSVAHWGGFESQLRFSFVMKAAGDYKPQFVVFFKIFTMQLPSFVDLFRTTTGGSTYITICSK